LISIFEDLPYILRNSTSTVSTWQDPNSASPLLALAEWVRITLPIYSTRCDADGYSGKRHAINFHDLTQRATVVAASTPDAEERRWAETNLEGVKIYATFDEMLEQESLHAVVVASATSVHAEQALKAIAKGYHVLCEKPLSIDLTIVSVT
jgi:hypothetical protein